MSRFFKNLALVLVLVAQAMPQAPKPTTHSPSDCGPLLNQAQRCPEFGFTYTVPFGWVDRTEEMQHLDADEVAAGPAAQSADSQTLLAVFERPPAAPGDTINSAVVIVAESLKQYPGVKTAADYFGAVTEIAEKRRLKVVNEPYGFSAGARHLVRADYSTGGQKITVFQSTLVVIEKGYILSFTFVGGSEDEIGQLIGQLSFTRTAPARK